MTQGTPRLLLTHDHLEYRGGGEQMLLRVAARSARAGPSELLLCWGKDKGCLTPDELGLFDAICLPDFPHRVRPGTWLQHRRANAQVTRLLQQDSGFAGILCFSLRSAIRMAPHARRLGLPLAWMCQQSFPLFQPPLAWAKQWVGIGALRAAKARIVCIAGEAVEAFAKMGFPREHLVLLRNGINVPRFTIQRPDAATRVARLRELGLPPDAFVLVCVARLDPIKNHPVALRALRSLLDRNIPATLLLVGGEMPHAPHHAAALHQLAGTLGLRGHVAWLGEQVDTRPYLALADAALLPSVQEAAGLVLAEAGAAGLPLLGSRRGGIPEIVRPGQTGLLFEADSPEELADAVARLHSDPALRAACGSGARQLVNTDFNSSTLDARWDLFLASLRSGWVEPMP